MPQRRCPRGCPELRFKGARPLAPATFADAHQQAMAAATLPHRLLHKWVSPHVIFQGTGEENRRTAKSRRRLRLMAAALLLSCAAANPATARVGMYQPKVVADLQLMTAPELGLEATRACDAAVGSRVMADSDAVIQLGKQSAYLGESREHRDYLSTVLRVLRAKLGREPLWMVQFRQAALGQDPEACSQAHTRSFNDTVNAAPR